MENAAPQLCRECGTMVRSDASTCPECGADLSGNDGRTAHRGTTAEGAGRADNPQGGSLARWKKGCLWLLAVVFGLALLGALFGDENGVPPAEDSAGGSASSHEDLGLGNAADEGDGSSASEDDGIIEQPAAMAASGPVTQARRSAESYLAMSGFSRLGLIEQLSSSAGEGFDVGDATAAVDSLDVNWNEQAVRSAASYLEMMAFSCAGLTEQLSSASGEKFTPEQARFGANAAGAC